MAQIDYLKNMAAGKTSTGGVANQGQISWAKAQLAKQPEPQPTNNTVNSAAGSGVSSILNNTGTTRGVNVQQAFNNNTNPTPQYGYNFNQTQQNDLLSMARNQLMAPREEFKVDLSSLQQDPTYIAAMDNAKQTAQIAAGNISSDLNRRGIMDSDINSRASSNAAENAYSRVSAEVLPGLIEKSYQRFMDRQNADRTNSLDLIGLSDTYGNNNQTMFNNSLSVSDRTGYLTLPEAQGDIDRLLNLKTATERNWQSMTPEQRLAAQSEGDDIRSRLTRMGIDVSNIGANTNSKNASANAGIQTLSGRNQDLLEQNQTFSQGITMAELTGTLPNGTKTTAEQQRQLENEWLVSDHTGQITPALSQLYGIPAGTPTRAAYEFAQNLALDRQRTNISQQNANRLSSGSSSGGTKSPSISNLITIWKATGSAPEGIPGVTPGTPYKSGAEEKVQKVSSKDSTNNYNSILDDLLNDKTVTKAEARDLLAQNAMNLTDADYKRLNDYINENY